MHNNEMVKNEYSFYYVNLFFIIKKYLSRIFKITKVNDYNCYFYNLQENLYNLQ